MKLSLKNCALLKNLHNKNFIGCSKYLKKISESRKSIGDESNKKLQINNYFSPWQTARYGFYFLSRWLAEMLKVFLLILKGLSYEIDFENVDENGQILA